MNLEEIKDYNPQQLAEIVLNLRLDKVPSKGIVLGSNPKVATEETFGNLLSGIHRDPESNVLLEDTSSIAQLDFFGDGNFLQKTASLDASLIKIEEGKSLSFEDKKALANYPTILTGLERNWEAWIEEFKKDNKAIAQGEDIPTNLLAKEGGQSVPDVAEGTVSAQSKTILVYRRAIDHIKYHIAPILSNMCRQLGIQPIERNGLAG